jgi:hypothetical protein
MGTFYLEALVDPTLETFSSSFGDTLASQQIVVNFI